MDFGLSAYGLSFVAGGLSTLSPCGGLMLSFTVVGVFIASLGASIGIDQGVFRSIAAVILASFGVILLSSQLQERFAVATSGVSGAGQSLLAKLTLDGLPGQFVLGLLLGVVWSPCVGPTLGAAITVASQGEDLGKVAMVMAAFGLGAGLPLMLLGLASREAMMRIRGRLMSAGKLGKKILGAVMLLLGGAILSGADKLFETWVLNSAPDWLVRLTTSI
jgi:cytochrome c biogenesis protein CcdA